MPAVVDFDLRQVDKAFKRMARAGVDLRPVWRDLRKPFRKDQRDHLREQKTASGATYKPLAASTKEKRIKALSGNRRNFTKRGRLRKSASRRLNRVLSAKLVSGAKVKLQPREMTITSKVPWAGVHQFGGRVGRGARVPARSFMYVGQGMQQQAVDAIREHLVKSFYKGRLPTARIV